MGIQVPSMSVRYPERGPTVNISTTTASYLHLIISMGKIPADSGSQEQNQASQALLLPDRHYTSAEIANPLPVGCLRLDSSRDSTIHSCGLEQNQSP